MKNNALVVRKPKDRLQLVEQETPRIAPDDVLVRVRYCGVCHTDVHEIDNDWGRGPGFFPFVPGHEVIGEITEVGSTVRQRKVGDVVGVGWQRAACNKCFACKKGWRNVCENAVATYDNGNGGFQQYISCQAEFAVPIPLSLQVPEAAPLLCGGITVFNPLVLHGVEPWMRTAVVGLGGLGHLGVKFMAAMGCDTTVITRDVSKKPDALAFGAKAFYQKLSEVPARSLDFILVTIPVPFDVKLAMTKLRAHGKLCVVGAIVDDLSYNAFDLLDSEASIVSSSIGDPKTIKQMLDFCVEHKITATSEIYDSGRADEAVSNVRANKARYRAVLDLSRL